MQYLLGATDAHQIINVSEMTCLCRVERETKLTQFISNNKHKKQSQNNVQYKAAKPKTISLDEAI